MVRPARKRKIEADESGKETTSNVGDTSNGKHVENGSSKKKVEHILSKDNADLKHFLDSIVDKPEAFIATEENRKRLEAETLNILKSLFDFGRESRHHHSFIYS